MIWVLSTFICYSFQICCLVLELEYLSFTIKPLFRLSIGQLCIHKQQPSLGLQPYRTSTFLSQIFGCLNYPLLRGKVEMFHADILILWPLAKPIQLVNLQSYYWLCLANLNYYRSPDLTSIFHIAFQSSFQLKGHLTLMGPFDIARSF